MEGSGAASLPFAISGSSTFHPVETIFDKEIPVVDFSLLINGEHSQRSQIIRDIGRACEEWSCFLLVNHGVPESSRSSMVKALREFFDLPVEERREFLGKKVIDPIRHEAGLTSTVEGWQYWKEFVRIFVHPALHSPPKPLHFRAICEEYARQTREIGIKLLNGIGESLGLEESYMEKTFDLANGHQILAGNRYPPSQQHEPAIGQPPHSDPPLLSLIMQDGSIDGLQVLHEGQWVLVRLMPGSFLVHTGDLLEIASNGKYKSLRHMVRLNNESTRMSVVAALGPPAENVVSPLPKLVEIANNISIFRSIKYVELVELNKDNRHGKSALSLIRL